MKYNILAFMLLALLYSIPTATAQKNRNTFQRTITDPNAKPPAAVMVDVAYGMSLPEGDLAEYFVYNLSLGGKVQYLLPNNWMVGITGDYHFSDDIKKDVISNLRVADGSIIDKFGSYSDAALGQRGFYLGGTVGYLLPVLKTTKRSGIEFRFSGGYLQHWVDIEVIGSEVFALADNYKKGYDRMSSGVAFAEYIGYRHLDKGGLLNFFGGFEFTQGVTKNRRGFNYDTQQEDTNTKFDMLIGFKVGLSIPFYIYSIDTQQETRYY